jgi:hypothetical protein
LYRLEIVIETFDVRTFVTSIICGGNFEETILGSDMRNTASFAQESRYPLKSAEFVMFTRFIGSRLFRTGKIFITVGLEVFALQA